MNNNELIEEKYKAQRYLSKMAKKHAMDYLNFVEKEVLELYKTKGWKLNFCKRKGKWIAPKGILNVH